MDYSPIRFFTQVRLVPPDPAPVGLSPSVAIASMEGWSAINKWRKK